jgi:hypothetical protein
MMRQSYTSRSLLLLKILLRRTFSPFPAQIPISSPLSSFFFYASKHITKYVYYHTVDVPTNQKTNNISIDQEIISSNTFKRAVSQDTELYFRILKIKPVLSVRSLMVFTFFYDVVCVILKYIHIFI